MANASAQKVKGIVEALDPVPSVAAAARRDQEALEAERERLAAMPRVQPASASAQQRRHNLKGGSRAGAVGAGGAAMTRQSSLPSMSSRPAAVAQGERRLLKRAHTVGTLNKSTAVWKALGECGDSPVS